MASRSTSSTSAKRKTTPAGRKARTSPTRRSAAAETTAAKSTIAEPKASKATAATTAAKTADNKAKSEAATEAFKRPDLIDAVAKRSVLKRSDARTLIELVLEELGKAADANDELVLPPFGKLMVKNRKPNEDGPDILTVKLRRPPAEKAQAETPLAASAKDS